MTSIHCPHLTDIFSDLPAVKPKEKKEKKVKKAAEKKSVFKDDVGEFACFFPF